MNLTERLTPILEHLLFVAFLFPTFILLAAAAVSLARPDPSVATPALMHTAMACEPCGTPSDE